MGGEMSTRVMRRMPPEKIIDYFAITIRLPNKIKLINAGYKNVYVMQYVMKAYNCVQSEWEDEDGNHTFQMIGTPFDPGQKSKHESLVYKALFCEIFRQLFLAGWETVITSEIIQWGSCGAIFFRRRNLSQIMLPPFTLSTSGESTTLSRLDLIPSPPQANAATGGVHFVCIGPSAADELLLVNIPKHIGIKLIDAISRLWKIRDESIMYEDASVASHCLKLCGKPWLWPMINESPTHNEEDSTDLRMLFLELLRLMRSYNYRFSINAALVGTDGDCLFFQYDTQLHGAPEDLFLLYISHSDKVNLLGAPRYMVATTKESINNYWYRGIHDEGFSMGKFEFCLVGWPWSSTGEDSIEARFLVANIIKDFRAQGWQVNGTLNIAPKQDQKTIFVFAQSAAVSEPWMCISLHWHDRVRLLGEAIGQHEYWIIERRLNFNVTQPLVQKRRQFGRSIEWKIFGQPFGGEPGCGRERAIILQALLGILKDLEEYGWKLVASADVSSKLVQETNHDFHVPSAMHSWFFLWDPHSTTAINNQTFKSKMIHVQSPPMLNPPQSPLGQKSNAIHKLSATARKAVGGVIFHQPTTTNQRICTNRGGGTLATNAMVHQNDVQRNRSLF